MYRGSRRRNLNGQAHGPENDTAKRKRGKEEGCTGVIVSIREGIYSCLDNIYLWLSNTAFLAESVRTRDSDAARLSSFKFNRVHRGMFGNLRA